MSIFSSEWFWTGMVLLPVMGVVGVIIFWTLRNGISPMPTSPKVKQSLLKCLPMEVKGTVYELGSGWGTLLFSLGKHYPDHMVIGFETSPIPLWVSKMYLKCMQLPKVQLQRRDFFEANLSSAGLAVCYLYPGAMVKLRHKFERELKPGTYVISHTFAVPGWKAAKIVEINDLYKTKIYIYYVI